MLFNSQDEEREELSIMDSLRALLESLSREDLEFVSECCAVYMDENEPLSDHIDDLLQLVERGNISREEIIHAANEGGTP